MLVHFRRLSKDVLIYGSGRIAVQALGFLTVPVYTRLFSTSDYGVIESIGAFASVVALVASLGMESASQRSFFDYTPIQADERRGVLSTAFWTLLVWSGILGISLSLGRIFVSKTLLESSNFSLLVGLAMLTIPVSITSNYFREILRMRHQPERFAILSVINGLAFVGSSLYLVAMRGLGLLGYYLGALTGSLVAQVASWWVVRDGIHLTFNRRELRVMLAYGLPLVPVAASMLVLQVADRFFLLHYASTSEVGLYSLSVRLSNLLLFGVTAFGSAWSPFMLELYNRDPSQERSVRAQTLTLVTLVLCIGSVCLSVFAREFFLTVTDPAYENSYRAVALLCGSIVALGMNSVIMSGITLSRQTHYFTRYTIIAAVINLGLNFLVIPPWGMVGAATATFLSYVLLSVLYTYRAQVLDPAPFDYRRLGVILAVSAAAAALGTFLHFAPLGLSLAIKSLLLIIYLGVIIPISIDARTLSAIRIVMVRFKERLAQQRP